MGAMGEFVLVIVVMLGITLFCIFWVQWAISGSSESVEVAKDKTNAAFEAYRKQILENLGQDTKSFKLFLEEKDREADKKTFKEWEEVRRVERERMEMSFRPVHEHSQSPGGF